MKKISCFAIGVFLMIATHSAHAQFVFSPKIGVNASALEARIQDIQASARYGWNAGIDFQFGGQIAFVRPGIHYYDFTARLLQDIQRLEDVAIQEETTIQSVKVPLNGGLRLTGSGGIMGIQVHGGLTPSYVLGVKERNAFLFDRSDLKAITWGANFGVGVDFLVLTVEANYEMGLTPFFAQADGKNNILTVSAGLKF
jgi:hypothetical protein